MLRGDFWTNSYGVLVLNGFEGSIDMWFQLNILMVIIIKTHSDTLPTKS